MMHSGLNFRLPALIYYACLPALSCALPIPIAKTIRTVVCNPTDWQSLLLFFLVNYASHAATVPLSPGGTLVTNLPWVIIALMFPLAGLGKSVALILTQGLYVDLRFRKAPEVRRAAIRGAFVVAMRTPQWKPATTHEERVCLKLKSPSKATAKESKYFPKAELNFIPFPFCPVNLHTHSFHYKDLPDGYQWCSPTHFGLIDLLSNHENLERAKDIPLGRSQSRMKMFVSVVQLTASCVTLYRSSGSELDRYGYAAFGLTVFPYTLMSLVNFICLAVVGDYPCAYILSTGILREAEQRMKGAQNGNQGCLDIRPDLHVPLEVGKAKSAYSSDDESSSQQVVSKDPESATLGGGEETGLKGDGFQVVTLQVVEEEGRTVLRMKKGDLTTYFTLTDETSRGEDAYVLEIHPILDSEPKTMKDIVKAGQKIWMDVLSTHWGVFAVVATFLGLGLPYLVIYFLTRFREQQSTIAQRAWIISWLVANQAVGLSLFVLSTNHPSLSFTLPRPLRPGIIPYAALTLFLFLLWLSLPLVPAIGGFVTVGKMLFEFGTCSLSPT